MWPSGQVSVIPQWLCMALRACICFRYCGGENKTSSVAQREKEVGSGRVDTEFTEQITSDSEKIHGVLSLFDLDTWLQPQALAGSNHMFRENS